MLTAYDRNYKARMNMLREARSRIQAEQRLERFMSGVVEDAKDEILDTYEFIIFNTGEK